jgi:hypothetical protein
MAHVFCWRHSDVRQYNAIKCSLWYFLTVNEYPSLIYYFYIPLPRSSRFLLLFRTFNVIFKNKNTNHQQMHKQSFIINRNTLLHVLTLLGHLQGELFVIVTLSLHFIVE